MLIQGPVSMLFDTQDALREALLRERTGRKPDQGAQAPSRLGPHVVHQGHRQPVPIAASYAFWRDAQFDTIRLCLIKVAARVTEMVTRIKIALPSAFPYQAGFADLAGRIAKLPP